MVDLRQNAEARSILERDGDHLLPVYARYPVVMERGEGVYLFDSSGNRYLDLMAGLGVNALGHAHPRMVAAMADQAAKIVHLSPQYANRYPAELGERLCSTVGDEGRLLLDRRVGGGGGRAEAGADPCTAELSATEAWDCGAVGSYHGRTYGSLR